MTKSVLRALFSRVAGFLIFLILLLAANFLMDYIPGSVYSSVVLFINYNVGLFFIMMLIGIASDVLWIFDFPLNLPAPIASAFLSYYIIIFIFRFFIFIRTYIYFDFVLPFSLLYVVPLVVLLGGYLLILIRRGKSRKSSEEKEEPEEKREAKPRVEKPKEKSKIKSKKVEWGEVGNVFKLALYGFGKKLNRLFE